MSERRRLDPILLFVVLGAGLVGLHQLTRGEDQASAQQIVVTDADVTWLLESFERTRLRPPTRAELEGLVDRHVRNELLFREATALGLDREDPALRRRLAMKLEYLAKDLASQVEPTEADLRAWLEAHPERYAEPPRRAFLQVYVSTDRHGDDAGAHAESLLATLRGRSPPPYETLGDPTMLEASQPLSTPREVSGLFGKDFADALFELPAGRWEGPVASGYGLHLVRVMEALPSREATLERVREAVRNDVLDDRRGKATEAYVEALRAKYGVEIRARLLDPDTDGS